MIPKIIHQIWIGNNKIPDEFVEFSKKWIEMYPDFEYKIWNDNNVNPEYFFDKRKLRYYNDNEFKIALKADMLRYEIIRKYGGVYIDVDTEPLRRMDDSIFDFKFFAGVQKNGEINNSLFGAITDDELIKDVCDNIVNNIESRFGDGILKEEIQYLTGPSYFTDVCKSYFDEEGYKFLEEKYFYPYWFLEPHRRFENFKETCPDAYSVHHWALSWKY